MKRKLLTGFFFIVATTPVFAFNKTSIDSLNFNIEKCFEQTKKEQGAWKRYCNYVIRSDIADRENKAVALHNRGVINLNNGDYLAALKDFETAFENAPGMKRSLLAAKHVRKTMHAKTNTN